MADTDRAADKTAVVILAGGQSRRFGTDKALALLPRTNQSFLEHAVGVASQVTSTVWVVAPDRPGYEIDGSRLLIDKYPGEGPLGGIVTALGDKANARILVFACDQIALRSSDLKRLGDEQSPTGVAVFRSSDPNRIHPLPMAIDIATAGPAIIRSFAEGERSLLRMLSAVGCERVLADTKTERRLRDVDTVEDLAAYSPVPGKKETLYPALNSARDRYT